MRYNLRTAQNACHIGQKNEQPTFLLRQSARAARVRRHGEHMSNKNGEDFTNFLGATTQTRKEALLEKCRKLNVSIHVDDPTETSSGAYANLRGLASEAELERRLNSKITARTAVRAFWLSTVAIFVSVAALVKSFHWL